MTHNITSDKIGRTINFFMILWLKDKSGFNVRISSLFSNLISSAFFFANVVQITIRDEYAIFWLYFLNLFYSIVFSTYLFS